MRQPTLLKKKCLRLFDEYYSVFEFQFDIQWQLMEEQTEDFAEKMCHIVLLIIFKLKNKWTVSFDPKWQINSTD